MDDQNKTNPPASGSTVGGPLPTPIKPQPAPGSIAAQPPPAGGPIPPMPEIADIPPPPPPIVEAPKGQKNDTAPPAGGAPTDSTIPTVITTSGGKPKGKGGKKKIIATVLGLLLLVGSVGIGTVLVQRNQDIREKASGTPTPTSIPISTASLGLTAQCLEVKVYDTEFNQLDTAGLAALNPGDSVVFTVAGTASAGTLTGARFIVNGVTRPPVTDKRPGTEEFMDTVVLPEGTSLTVNGEVQHSTAGWF